jgi:hypothetical protein
MEGVVLLNLEVAVVLEVGNLLVEPPSFQAVVDGGELLVFSLNLSNDCILVCLELGMSLVMMLVLLHLC